MNTLIWGIDPSLTATAIVGIKVTQLEGEAPDPPVVVVKQTLRCKQLRGVDRLVGLRRDLQQLIAQQYETPSIVVIEGYAFGAKMNREALGEWGGVLRLTLREADYPMLICPPTTLKAFTTGKGNAPKDIMVREVYRRWAYAADDHDDADAFALAMFGIAAAASSKTKAFEALARKIEVG